MKKFIFSLMLVLIITLAPRAAVSETIDVLIKGIDDGVKTSKQQDYKEAVMNAKLEAIERAGVEISSITRVVNFQTKFDMVESKAKAVLLPGFQVMDLGYQTDGTYLIVLSGKIQVGEKEKKKPTRKILGSPEQLEKYLFQAVKDGDHQSVEKLLIQGVYANIKNKDGETPLHVASKKGDTGAVKILLRNNANVNAKTNRGEISLHFAANAQVAELLLKKNPNPNVKDSNGETPLFGASSRGYTDTVELLLQKRANPNIKNRHEYTPLSLASMSGHKDVVQSLVEYNADVKMKDYEGKTALFHAVRAKHLDIAQILLDKGAPIQDYFMAVRSCKLNPSISAERYKKFDMYAHFIRWETYPENVYFRPRGQTEWLVRGTRSPHRKRRSGRLEWEVKKGNLIISWYTTYLVNNERKRKYAAAVVFPLDGKIKEEYIGWKFEFKKFKVKEFSFKRIGNGFEFREMGSAETKFVKGELCTLTPHY
jgi:ankyrin repeat protein